MRGKIAALVVVVAAAAVTAAAAAWVRERKEDEGFELEVSEPRSRTIDTRPLAPPRPPAPVEAPAAEAPTAAHLAPSVEAPAPPAPPAPVEVRERDDLTAIKGLGKVKTAKLVEAGVTSYAQIAAWSDDDIARFGLQTNTSPGQIKREDWIGQARAFAEG